jgi:hypothetical protein
MHGSSRHETRRIFVPLVMVTYTTNEKIILGTSRQHRGFIAQCTRIAEELNVSEEKNSVFVQGDSVLI